MKTPFLYLAINLVLSLLNIANSADFYLSPEGNDEWSGKLAKPNPEKNDGPFASLERARDAVRQLKKTQDIVVQIRGGNYRLDKTVLFTLPDSGSKNCNITYEAYPGEKPIFSSDRNHTDWSLLEKFPTALPKQARGKVWVTDTSDSIITLYDKNGRLPRARSEGFIPIMPDNPKEDSKSNRIELHFPQGTLKKWPNLQDIELLVRPNHAWVVNLLPLQSVNTKRQIAKVGTMATYAMDELHFLKGTKSVWVENAIDFLDKPGEWVLDTSNQKLYLWPRDDTPPQSINSPKLKEYIRVEGAIEKGSPTDTPVKNLVFRGLTFTRGETYRIAKDDKGLQHDWEFQDKANALLRLRGAENCVIEKCHFTQSGGPAIRLDLHAINNQIRSNHIEHIGGTGILLCGYGPGTKDANLKNLVFNNHIHNVGEIFLHSPGILLWQSGQNRVANNLIHHTPYSGIIISGVMDSFFSRKTNARELVRTIRWDELDFKPGEKLPEKKPFLHTHDNLVENNEIHHAMETLGDGNGIYIRGAGPNNVIRRNYIHDLLSTLALQSAIRTDGGQRDTLITENLIYRCTSQGIQLKLNNRAENNLIIDIIAPIHKGEKRQPAYFKLREGPMTGAVIQRNILYHPGDDTPSFYDEGRTMRTAHAWLKETDANFNLYHCPENPAIGKAQLKKGKRSGVDAKSLSADPLFVDLKNRNFNFQPNSPALKLGIIPIDLSKTGLHDPSQLPKN